MPIENTTQNFIHYLQQVIDDDRLKVRLQRLAAGFLELVDQANQGESHHARLIAHLQTRVDQLEKNQAATKQQLANLPQLQLTFLKVWVAEGVHMASYIHAIKLLRDHNRALGLKEAKDLIDSMSSSGFNPDGKRYGAGNTVSLPVYHHERFIAMLKEKAPEFQVL